VDFWKKACTNITVHDTVAAGLNATAEAASEKPSQ